MFAGSVLVSFFFRGYVNVQPLHILKKKTEMSDCGCELKQQRKIELTLLNGKGVLFNPDDYIEIRRKHRVIGSLIGACNYKGWNPQNNTLPVEFTQCETQLLVERGIVVVLRKESSLARAPRDSTVQEYKNYMEHRISEQAKVLKAGKIKNSARYADKILAGKRNRLLQSGVDAKDVTLTEEDVLKEIEMSVTFDRSQALIEVPFEHTLEHEAEVVTFPIVNSLKYKVFKDLWDRGKYVTSGETFGADFLAYPGDPLMFHASHIVIIVENPIVSQLDLICKCRLSVIVNKICIFAYLRKGKVCYQSIFWEGCKDIVKTAPAEPCSQ